MSCSTPSSRSQSEFLLRDLRCVVTGSANGKCQVLRLRHSRSREYSNSRSLSVKSYGAEEGKIDKARYESLCYYQHFQTEISAQKTGLPQWLRDEVEQMTCASTRLELEHKAEMARILKSAAMGVYIGRMESSKQGIWPVTLHFSPEQMQAFPGGSSLHCP